MATEIKNGVVLLRGLIVGPEVTLPAMVNSLKSVDDTDEKKLWLRVPMALFDREHREFANVRVAVKALQYPFGGVQTPFEGEIMSVSEVAQVSLLGAEVRGTIHLAEPWIRSTGQGELECYKPETAQ
jgi:hypothetical protein